MRCHDIRGRQSHTLLEQLEVAEQASWLIDSIEDGAAGDENHAQAWDAEITRRSAEIHAGIMTGIPE